MCLIEEIQKKKQHLILKSACLISILYLHLVGNIPYEASEEQLKDIFSEVGPVVSFRSVSVVQLTYYYTNEES